MSEANSRGRLRAALAGGATLLLIAGLAGGARAGGAAGAPDARIVGGTDGDLASWGFTVGLRRKKKLFCTGSVIAPTRVLTAAHCVRHKGVRKMRVVANRTRIRSGKTGEVIGVADVNRYPSYRKNQRHDLAVVTLKEPTTAPPIAIATPAESVALTRPGAPAYASGFGDRKPLFTSGLKVGALKVAEETVRRHRRCRRFYGRRGYVAKTMICSIGHRFGRKPIRATVCFGDSGGPLVAPTPSGPRLVGVTSFSAGLGNVACGFRAAPSVYARVTSELPFIVALIS